MTYSPTQQNAPTENAEGHTIWKPSVGVVFKPAENRAQSYGGIIGALQDAISEQGIPPKAYPHNFAGIIAAIQDLEAAGVQIPVVPDVKPPGSIIDENGDTIIITPPTDGSLWFDTRQGRLFVAIDGEWWQTNGADGLAYLRESADMPPMDQVVPGQFWYSTDDHGLFIYDGENWVLVADATTAGSFQTTATLPLANVGPKAIAGDHDGKIITPIDLEDFNTQLDYNQWLYAALLELEAELESFDPVVIGEDKPDTPRPGALWYDTESLELSIWYEDDDGGQWVPTAASYTYDEDLAVLSAAIENESRIRESALHQLQEQLDAIDAADNAEVAELINSIAALQQTVAKKADGVDLDPLATSQDVIEKVSNLKTELTTSINTVRDSVPSLNGYVTEGELDEEVQIIENHIAEKTTMEAVVAFVDETLANSNYSTQAYLDQSLATLSQNYLTHAGGTLTGNLIINKVDLGDAALDFSDSPESGSPAFKFYTQSNDYYTSYCPTFGTTRMPGELAWNFEGDEDFCWIYNDSNKVFSITKEGPACSTLILGDIGSHNNGRYIHNKIDVKERLNSYRAAFQQMRQGISDATDFDTLKANILSALASV